MAAPLLQGALIDSSNFVEGASLVDLGYATLSASGTFHIETTYGYSGVGVGTGLATDLPREIQGGELITITFLTPVYINFIDLSLLYTGAPDPNFGPAGDETNEIADIKGYGAVNVFGTLQPTGPMTATWTGPGSVTNLAPAIVDSAGAWRINNPFGAALITSIEFNVVTKGPPDVTHPVRDSDYALVGVDFSEIPEPTTMVLAGLGLAAMGASRRWRKTHL